MQQTWNLAQLFSFVRESDGQMSAEEICISFADLFDEGGLVRLGTLYRDYWRFVRASELAVQNSVEDAVGGFRIVLPAGHNLLAYEYQHAEALAWARRGHASDWLAENPEVAHRWDTAGSVPTLSGFLMSTAADHAVADIKAFLETIPSARTTIDGCYIPLLIPSEHFEDYRLAFSALPFADIFHRDFIVDGQEKTI
jgi:hypothetical protein